MSEPQLGDIRICLEGVIPAVMATCAADGMPNVAYISQVYYVDERHVALSFQFFNKTRQNILANPRASVQLIHPQTAAFYRLHIRYLRTETQGPLFEGMKAQLAGIASHTGMQGVFRLLGSDVYEVERIEAVPGAPLPLPAPRSGMLAAVRRCSERLARCASLDEALNAVLATLTDFMGVEHGMVLMLDDAAQRLYTVASCGYATSGVGSEVLMGEGVIGVAARERTPVRVSHMTNAYLYSQAMRSSFEANIPDLEAVTQIPYPGLAEPHSQLAVPVMSAGKVLGVLFVESPHDLQFGFEDEDMLVAVAGHLGATIDLMQATTDAPEAAPPAIAPSPAAGAPLQLRHYASNDSVFVGDTYLIKGVAGAILWKLLNDHRREGRTEFSNRELRLDASIGLPDVSDNLEARLVLLRRRLEEHGGDIRIEKTGRGRFRLDLARPVVLTESS
ncbi:GAF domain-containing protein [Caenimonas aquaedulcis]|uniref:GAF domain-containing protein n=1 Tax=Caenimonas aquaedulcis TaxID=2793270 RepID=A0A931H689_9BURK|nr:GAF domain-containing protein [Caenimonas aquaedulcis]MBG9389436.1 GAF domain-containing protein [Caenimonas aquaedulcis]